MNPLRIALLTALLAQPFLPAVLPLTQGRSLALVLGCVLVCCGLALALTARVQLARQSTNPKTAAPHPPLLDTGIYARLRHPFYSSCLLLLAGYQLALGSWLFTLAFPLALYLWRTARAEESRLARTRPGYPAYRARTGMFAPPLASVGLAGLAIAFTLQLYLVYGVYNAHWTALFLQGDYHPAPPVAAAEHTHVFPNSTGYDGQFYHYIAHDPLLQSGVQSYIDAPRLRYRRILLPGAAWLAALGHHPFIDPALLSLSLLPFFLGPFWLAGYARSLHRSPWWGLAFLLMPASIISIERLTVDLWLMALTAGLLRYAHDEKPHKRLLVLALAPLARETGILLTAAAGLAHLLARSWRHLALTAAALLPAALWTLYVHSRTLPFVSRHLAPETASNALLRRIFSLTRYDLPPLIATVARICDILALAAILLAMALAAIHLRRNWRTSPALASAAFASLPILLGGIVGWWDPFGYARTMGPLLLLVAFNGLPASSRLAWLPVALSLPRIALQLAPLLPGVRSLLR